MTALRAFGRIGRTATSAAGHFLIAVGVLSVLYPVLLSGPAEVLLYPGGLLQSLDRLAQAVVISAGIPTLDTNLPLHWARLAGVLIFMLGGLAVVAAKRREKQRETD